MSHTAEPTTVGTGLLLGSIANTDAQMFSRGLPALDINAYYHTVMGDNLQRLRVTVELAKSRTDIPITTGGLGPTHDDPTKNALAEYFGKKLVLRVPSARRIEAYSERLHAGHSMMGGDYQQAMLPEGCTVLDSDWGTVLGVAFKADGVRVVMLPGPPWECRAMFTHRVIPYLKSLTDRVIASRTLRLFGIGESPMETQPREGMEAMTNPTLAPYAKGGECGLYIIAEAADEESARTLIIPVEERLRVRFGPLIYGTGVPSLEAVVFQLLKEKGFILGRAESCTGGLATKRMADLSGVSVVSRDGMVSYTAEMKYIVLGVEQALLDKLGTASEPATHAMAEGTRRVLGYDLAVASADVAGPGPDGRGNPMGLAYLALATPDGTWVRKIQQGLGRERVRHVPISHGSGLARRYLSGLEVE